jgi:hypothetical protein
LARNHLPLGIQQLFELFGCDETLFDQDFTKAGSVVPAPLLFRCLGELVHRNHFVVNRKAAEERDPLIGHGESSIGRAVTPLKALSGSSDPHKDIPATSAADIRIGAATAAISRKSHRQRI